MLKILENKINKLVGNMNWYDVDENHPNFTQIEKLYNEYIKYIK